MEQKIGEVIDNLISIGLMSFIAIFLNNKRKEQPLMKIYGLPIKTIIILVCLGIAIDVLLAVVTLVK